MINYKKAAPKKIDYVHPKRPTTTVVPVGAPSIVLTGRDSVIIRQDGTRVHVRRP